MSTTAWIALLLTFTLLAVLVIVMSARARTLREPQPESGAENAPTLEQPEATSDEAPQPDELTQAAATRGITIRPLVNEHARQAAYALLRSQISDPSLFPYLPERDAVLLGRRIPQTHETILAALDKDKTLLGAAYFGPEWTSVFENELLAGIPAEYSLDAYNTVTILHGIATTPEARGTGVGRLLLRAVEEHALRFGALAIAGVASPEERGFYQRCGYTMLGHEMALVMHPAARGFTRRPPVVLPITGESQWFAKAMTNTQVVGGAQVGTDGSSSRFALTAGSLTPVC